MYLFVYIFVYFLTSAVTAKNEDYKGYKVYNIKLESNAQQENLPQIKDDLIDFWKIPSFNDDVVGKAMVPDSKLHWFEDKLNNLGIKRDVFVEDVPGYLKQFEKNAKTETRNGGNRVFGFDGYYRYDEILKYLYSLQETTTNSSITATIEQFGETEQGRPLVYFNIKKDSNDDAVKPIVVIEAAINPREWVTVSAAMNVVEKLLETEREFLEESDWIVIPVLNPDGYEYTHTNQRLWTKTLSTKTDLGLICPGANINRNFDPNWLLFDSSSSPCSPIYSGIEPFSEIETQMIRHLIQTYGTQIRLYISLQNNGGVISYPFQYERAASGMFRQHHLLALEMAEAMVEDYKVAIGYQALGDRVSGTSTDYAQHNGLLYPFTIHIVEGEDGINIPEERIVDIIEDVWRAVKVAAARLL